MLLEEQKDDLSELNMQELRVEDADRVLHESGPQLHFERMELYQMNQLCDHSQREKRWLCTELDRREKVVQEDRVRSLEYIEDFFKVMLYRS